MIPRRRWCGGATCPSDRSATEGGHARDVALRAISPDRRTLAFAPGDEIYVAAFGDTPICNISRHQGYDGRPAWSPDGTRIARMADRDGNPESHVMDADGADQACPTTSLGSEDEPDWSPDRTMTVFASDRDGNSDVYLMSAMDPTRCIAPTRFTQMAAAGGPPMGAAFCLAAVAPWRVGSACWTTTAAMLPR